MRHWRQLLEQLNDDRSSVNDEGGQWIGMNGEATRLLPAVAHIAV